MSWTKKPDRCHACAWQRCFVVGSTFKQRHGAWRLSGEVRCLQSGRSYVIYVEDAQENFELQRVVCHLFASDMQGHTSARSRNARSIASNMQECIVAVSNWCTSKRIQLNAKLT